MIKTIDHKLAILPPRKPDANKSDFGRVLVVGGDHGMMGAVLMTATAALRVGAGVVTVATQPEHALLLTEKRPELMCHGVTRATQLQTLIENATVIVVGPGLGQSEWSRELFFTVLSSTLPLVIDADGLNLLSQHSSPATQKNPSWILTPHPGEAARLLHTTTEKIQHDREQAANDLQQQYSGVIVLKGAGTLVTDGHEIKICDAGNPGMATAGMGDILAGIIGGLVAQQLPLFIATQTGVLLHAQAGDRAAAALGQAKIIATDILTYF